MSKKRQESINQFSAREAEKSFTEAIKNDEKIWKDTLNRPEEMEKGLNASEKPSQKDKEDENKRANFLTRVLLAVGSADVKIFNETDSKEIPKSGKDNKLPLVTYLSHGGRVLIEIPKLEAGQKSNKHQVFKWLMTGEADSASSINSKISYSRTGEEAKDQGKIVYNRWASTHDITFDEKGNPVEKKLNHIQALGKTIRAFDTPVTKNWGVDVAMGGYKSKDIHGKIIKPDGTQGHVLVYYTPPTENRAGAFLIGIEGSAPLKDSAYGTHGPQGTNNPASITHGKNLENLKEALIKEQGKETNNLGYTYEKTVLYQRIDGMKGKLDKKNVNDLVTLKNEDVNRYRTSSIPSITPQENFEELKKACKVPTEAERPNEIKHSNEGKKRKEESASLLERKNPVEIEHSNKDSNVSKETSEPNNIANSSDKKKNMFSAIPFKTAKELGDVIKSSLSNSKIGKIQGLKKKINQVKSKMQI